MIALRDIAFARSGDKGNSANVAVFARTPAAYTWLRGHLTAAAVESHAMHAVLNLRGAGAVFCSGLDLAEAAKMERALASADLVGKALHALAATRLITIACVQGAAIAGGAGLMSACDFAVATRD